MWISLAHAASKTLQNVSPGRHLHPAACMRDTIRTRSIQKIRTTAECPGRSHGRHAAWGCIPAPGAWLYKKIIKTENKTIRFPVTLINQIEETIRQHDVTFSGFVIQACEYALENMDSPEGDWKSRNWFLSILQHWTCRKTPQIQEPLSVKSRKTFRQLRLDFQKARKPSPLQWCGYRLALHQTVNPPLRHIDSHF